MRGARPAGIAALVHLAVAVACASSGDRASDTGAGGAAGAGGSADGGFAPGGASSGDPETCEEAKQIKAYVGCDFWPTVVANNVWSIFDFAVIVANGGRETAEVNVERQGINLLQATVEPNALATLYLPWVPELKGGDSDECGSVVPFTESVRVQRGAFHLTSTRPVTVYQFNALEYQGEGGPPGKDWTNCPGNLPCISNGNTPVGCYSFTNDASLLLPSTAMTGNYRLLTYQGWVEGAGPLTGSTFTVTGTADTTNVTVKLAPGASTLGGGEFLPTPGGGTLTFALDAGDVVEIAGASNADLGGSLIQADQPVQVMAGLPCVYIPSGNKACDHVEESVFPAETLGEHYFVVRPTGPHATAVDHLVKLFGNFDNTTLSYPTGAPPGAPTTLNAGDVVSLGQVDVDFEIVGDQAFGISTFQLGSEIVDGEIEPSQRLGDPSQSLVTALEQYRTTYVFLAPADYAVNFVDVVQAMDTTVEVDGVTAPPPVAIGSSGFGVARVALDDGTNHGAHVLTASVPVGIQVMGYGFATSYQYPGGLNLKVIAPPPE